MTDVYAFQTFSDHENEISKEYSKDFTKFDDRETVGPGQWFAVHSLASWTVDFHNTVNIQWNNHNKEDILNGTKEKKYIYNVDDLMEYLERKPCKENCDNNGNGFIIDTEVEEEQPRRKNRRRKKRSKIKMRR